MSTPGPPDERRAAVDALLELVEQVARRRTAAAAAPAVPDPVMTRRRLLERLVQLDDASPGERHLVDVVMDGLVGIPPATALQELEHLCSDDGARAVEKALAAGSKWKYELRITAAGRQQLADLPAETAAEPETSVSTTRPAAHSPVQRYLHRETDAEVYAAHLPIYSPTESTTLDEIAAWCGGDRSDDRVVLEVPEGLLIAKPNSYLSRDETGTYRTWSYDAFEREHETARERAGRLRRQPPPNPVTVTVDRDDLRVLVEDYYGGLPKTDEQRVAIERIIVALDEALEPIATTDSDG